MAQIRWYLNATLLDGWALVDQTAATAATLANGWVVGTGSTFSSEFQSAGGDRASTTFTANTVPDGTLDTTLKDAFRSQFPQTGAFAAGNWAFQFAVVSTVQSGAADGQIVFRILKADADGSNATQITTGQVATTVATNVAGTDVNITATWAAPAWTITNQYLFVQVAWKRTGAGGMTTTNIRLRTGSSSSVGTTGLTADFTHYVTTGTIASTVDVRVPTVGNTQMVTGGTVTTSAVAQEPAVVNSQPVTAEFISSGSVLTPPTVVSAASLVVVQTTTKVQVSSVTSITIPFATPPTVGNGIVIPLASHIAGSVTLTDAIGTAVDSNGQSLAWAVVASASLHDIKAVIYYLPKLAAVTAPYSVTISFNGFTCFGATACGIEVTNVDLGLTADTTAAVSNGSMYGSAVGPSSAATVDTVFTVALCSSWPSTSLSSLTVESVSPPWVQAFEELATFKPVCEADSRVLTGQTGLTQSCSWASGGEVLTSAAALTSFRASPVLVVVTPIIPRTSSSFAPTVVPPPVAVTGATIASAGAVFGPTVSTIVPATVGFSSLLAFWIGGAVPAALEVQGAHISGGDALLIEDGGTHLHEDGGTQLQETYPGTSQAFAPTVALDSALTVGAGTVAPTSAITPPSVAVGAVTVVGVTIASTATRFAPTVVPQAVGVTTGTIASTSSATGPTVTPQAVGITTAHRATTLVVNVPTVIPQTVTVTGAHIGSTVTVGAPAIVVMPGHIATTATLFAPTIVPQAVSVTAGTRPLTSSAFAPTVVPQAVIVVAGTVALTSLVRVPTVIPQAVGVTAGTVAATTVVRVPTVIPQTVGITAGTVSAADQRFAPTVAPGAVAVTAGTIAATSQTNVATVTVGPVAVLLAHIAVVVSLFVPAISQVAPGDIGGQNVPTSAVVYAPSVVGGLATINVPAIALTSSVAAPTIAVGPASVTGGTIATTAQSFAPTVVPQAVGIAAGHVATTNQRFAPTVAAGAVTVLAPTVASTVLLNPPTIVGAGAIVTAPLASTVVLNSPTLTVSAVSVTAQTVAATSQVFIPTVAVGVTAISGATVGTTAQIFAPAMIARLDGTFIASTSQLFPPTVIVTQSVTTGTIPTGILLFAPSLLPVEFVTAAHVLATTVLTVPTVTVGPATVVTGTIGSGSSATAPSQVLPDAVAVTTPPLVSTAQVFAPTLTAGLTAGHVPSGIQLFLPSLAAGPVTQLGATIDSTHVVFAPSLGAGISTAPIGSTSLTFAPTLTGIVVIPAWVITTELFPPSALPLGEMLGPTIPSGSVAFAPQMVAYAPPPEILDFVSNLVRDIDGEVVLCRGLDGTVILTRAVSVSATVDRVLEMSPSLVRRVVEVGSER